MEKKARPSLKPTASATGDASTPDAPGTPKEPNKLETKKAPKLDDSLIPAFTKAVLASTLGNKTKLAEEVANSLAGTGGLKVSKSSVARMVAEMFTKKKGVKEGECPWELIGAAPAGQAA